MGDTGSQTIGFIISIFAVVLIMNRGDLPVEQNFILALSPLIVPMFDLAHVAAFRLARGQHPFRPDKTHIHHRLIKKGFTSRQAVVLIFTLAIVYTLVNMLLADRMDVTLIVVADIAMWVAFNSKLISIKNTKLKQLTQTTNSQL
jgi:UDP-N-acetylmuramyl pentapeptide phosphotransferase/UDP-N-acetylglucosamine-1-phosphate transferase